VIEFEVRSNCGRPEYIDRNDHKDDKDNKDFKITNN
jgi:hypothetical protein